MQQQFLRVLQVEDSESDAELINRILSRANYQVRSIRVDDRDQLRAALQDQDWDVIIADYSLPQFDAPEALNHWPFRWPDGRSERMAVQGTFRSNNGEALYNLLLAEGGLTGWPLVSNTFVHVITPILTTLVWLIAGPRGLMSHRVIFGALVVPVGYVVWALVRGAAIGAYPYPFLDVAVKGYPYVLAFVCGLIVFAVLLAYVLWAVDTGLGRLTRPRAR